MKGPASPCEEDRALVGLDDEVGPGLVEIFLHPGDRALADRDDAILLALALADDEHAAGEIEIVEPQPDQLHPPQPRRVAGLEQRAATQPDRRPGLGRRQPGA